MKIVSIVGTRPNFIKILPLAPKLAEKFEQVVIHTGQHYDYEMAQIFFESLPLPKIDYHLTLGEDWSEIHKISEIMTQLEKILLNIKPDCVLVYGDVNSTLAAAITSSKLQILTGHIEAGVRLSMGKPPEEIIRKMVDNCCDLLFCPTESAMKNLKKENVLADYFLVGDVMYDAFLQNAQIAKRKFFSKSLNLLPKKYQVVTIHRAENTDNREKLQIIVEILTEFDIKTIFPCHPRTVKMLKQYDLWEKCQKSENLKIIPPLNYIDFLSLLIDAKKIITDSGGVQREAYFAKVPCIILYDSSPWPEIIQNGGAILVNTKESILNAVQNFNKVGSGLGFGDGHACEKIVKIVEVYQKN